MSQCQKTGSLLPLKAAPASALVVTALVLIIAVCRPEAEGYLDIYHKAACLLLQTFVKEVESIFSEAMVVQFLVMAWVICMTVYKIIGLSILSLEFVSMAVYLGCMLAQLFIYCYYGTQLKVESESVNQSVYSSDWLSLSPRYRTNLLIVMERWRRSIVPRVAYIVPMSLETYIAVIRSSYTLFTFLERK